MLTSKDCLEVSCEKKLESIESRERVEREREFLCLNELKLFCYIITESTDHNHIYRVTEACRSLQWKLYIQLKY